MINEEMTRIERELMAAQELLFMVLDHVGEPVRLNMEQARAKITKDRRIDLDLDKEKDQWVLSVVTVNE